MLLPLLQRTITAFVIVMLNLVKAAIILVIVIAIATITAATLPAMITNLVTKAERSSGGLSLTIIHYFTQ